MTIKLLLQMCLAALLTAATCLTLQFQDVLRGIQAQAEGVATQASLVAKATILSESSIARSIDSNLRGLNSNLSLITDPKEGHLATFNHNFGLGLMGVVANLHETNSTISEVGDSIQAAVYGTMDSWGSKKRSGLLDVTDKTAQLEGQIGDGITPFLDCTQNHRGNPGCLYSRWMALSGTLIRTAGTFEKHEELLLKQVEDFNTHFTGLTANAEKITGKFTAPCRFGCKLWAGTKLAVYGAAKAF